LFLSGTWRASRSNVSESPNNLACHSTNPGQNGSHLRRQVQSWFYAAGLNTQNVHIGTMRSVEELQDSQQAQFVQGVPSARLSEIFAAAIAEGARLFTHIHRIDHEDSSTLLEEGKCAEKVRFNGHDRRLGRRLGLQKMGGMYPHPVVGQQAVANPEDQIWLPRIHRTQQSEDDRTPALRGPADMDRTGQTWIKRVNHSQDFDRLLGIRHWRSNEGFLHRPRPLLIVPR